MSRPRAELCVLTPVDTVVVENFGLLSLETRARHSMLVVDPREGGEGPETAGTCCGKYWGAFSWTLPSRPFVFLCCVSSFYFRVFSSFVYCLLILLVV